ncbi:glycosyl transferase [Afipia sp. Root123D2]|uniref:glycosyl transferase n=1 Tax=Afipia sp. Root123D2 TaxID=1736436 RepID=UPI001FCCDAD6|nr:glycosyl transferase [Afipia sp. Root123D2]
MSDGFNLMLGGLVALVAALGTALLTWAIHPLLVRYALARPNARSSHKVPTPQGAGIAVVAVTLAVAAFAILTTNNAETHLVFMTFGATILLAIVGAVDDLRTIAVLPRLLLQAAAVIIVVAALPDSVRAMPQLPLLAERAMVFVAGLWLVNLVNFMDGIDWIMVAEVVPIAAALVLLCVAGEVSPRVGIVAAALGGAMIGFAPFNKPVAKVFLGDVGSLPIGLLLGWCLLALAWHGHLAAALLLPLYFLTDATATLLRRMWRREPFWDAHRSHFYQRATDNGFTVQRIVGEIFVLNVLLAALAGLSVTINAASMDVAALVAGLCATSLLLYRFSRPKS